MKRLTVLVSLVAMLALAALGATAAPAGAYGGGADHDMWQIGLSFNCNNPDICGTDLGGFWGWAELDRFADGTQTWGDAEFAFCFHTVGGGGGGRWRAHLAGDRELDDRARVGRATDLLITGEQTDTFHGTKETTELHQRGQRGLGGSGALQHQRRLRLLGARCGRPDPGRLPARQAALALDTVPPGR